MPVSSPSKRKTVKASTARAFAHIAIECIAPQLDGGRFPVKRVIGDSFEVSADIFKDGHDVLAARVRYRPPGDSEWRTAPMAFDYNSDRWTGGFPLEQIGWRALTAARRTDQFGTWRRDLQKKVDAGQDVSLELIEGAQMVDAAAGRVKFGETRNSLK